MNSDNSNLEYIINYFTKNNFKDKLELFEDIKKEYNILNELKTHIFNKIDIRIIESQLDVINNKIDIEYNRIKNEEEIKEQEKIKNEIKEQEKIKNEINEQEQIKEEEIFILKDKVENLECVNNVLDNLMKTSEDLINKGNNLLNKNIDEKGKTLLNKNINEFINLININDNIINEELKKKNIDNINLEDTSKNKIKKDNICSLSSIDSIDKFKKNENMTNINEEILNSEENVYNKSKTLLNSTNIYEPNISQFNLSSVYNKKETLFDASTIYNKEHNNYKKEPNNYNKEPNNYNKGPYNYNKEPYNYNTESYNYNKESDNYNKERNNYNKESYNHYKNSYDNYKNSYDNYRNGLDNYRNSYDNYRNGLDNYRNRLDNYRNLGDSYRNGLDNYRNRLYNYRNLGDNYRNEGDDYLNPDYYHRNLQNFYRNPSDNYRKHSDYYKYLLDNYKSPLENYKSPLENYKSPLENYKKTYENNKERYEDKTYINNVNEQPYDVNREIILIENKDADNILRRMFNKLKNKSEIETSVIYEKDEKIFYDKLEKKQKEKFDKLEEKILKLNNINVPLRFRILKSHLSLHNKAMIINKFNDLTSNKLLGGSEISKYTNWVNSLLKVPFKRYRELPLNITKTDKTDIGNYLINVRKTLDDAVFGHINTKEQITQIIAQWISNPSSIGNCIGIQGVMGNGKTTLVKNGIAKAIDRPFAFITLGGCSDSSYLDGHNYTYEGSTWGKIVDVLIECKCMNPVFYFDELDKVSETPKGEEIINTLIHLTDSSQNNEYSDKYFNGISFDLSKSLFIFSFNDKNKINPILLDRLICIETEKFTTPDKIEIANNYLLNEIYSQLDIDKNKYKLSNDLIEYIITTYTEDEGGVRNLKKILFNIFSKLNLLNLTKHDKNIKYSFDLENDILESNEITKDIIDKFIKNNSNENDLYYKNWYI